MQLDETIVDCDTFDDIIKIVYALNDDSSDTCGKINRIILKLRRLDV